MRQHYCCHDEAIDEYDEGTLSSIFIVIFVHVIRRIIWLNILWAFTRSLNWNMLLMLSRNECFITSLDEWYASYRLVFQRN